MISLHTKYKYDYGGYSITWDFSDIVYFALTSIEQVNSGCPADCEENPWYCNKPFDEMPRQCRDFFEQEMREAYPGIDDGCGCLSCQCGGS